MVIQKEQVILSVGAACSREFNDALHREKEGRPLHIDI